MSRLWPVTLCFLLLLTQGRCLALDPGNRVSQYAHTAWRIQDGYFSGMPNAITQTKDGYLWVGTQAGLYRFDGVHFLEWKPTDAQSFSRGIFSLLGGSDGSLWIGTGSNVVRLKDGHLTNYLGALGRVNSILEDSSGTVWTTRSHVQDTAGPLCQIAGAKLKCHGTGDGITLPYAGALANDSAGNLWIGSSGVLTHWKAGLSATYINPALKSVQGVSGIQALASLPDGSLLVGIIRGGPGMGLQQWMDNTWKPFRTSKLDGSTLGVTALFVDREKSIWIGTTIQGVFRVHEGKVDHFSSANGLSGDYVNSFYEDREGNLWVATTDGFDRFRSLPVVSFSTQEGLSANSVASVLTDRHGSIWIGNEGSLDSIRNGEVTSIQRKNGLPGGRVTSMFEDHAGNLWVGVDNGLSIYEGGRFKPIRHPDGTPIGTVIALAEDQEDNIWAEAIGSPPRLLRIKDRVLREEIPAPKIPPVSSLAADPHDGIWLGLTNGDLARYRHGQLETYPVRIGQHGLGQLQVNGDGSILSPTTAGVLGWKSGVLRALTVRNGLPCNRVYSLISDHRDNLWLYMQCGLVRVERSELQKWWQDANAKVQVRVFDALDGAQPSIVPFQPHVSRSPDGRLWFANETVLQTIDPEHLVENTMSPPVLVETIVADRKTYFPENNLRLPPITRDLEIDYTALSFAAPQRVRFRYMLEGHDVSWQEPGTRRQAFYSDLAPGKYRFHVIACNNDGLWNEAGATLDFRVMPAWYQANLFRIGCIVVILLMVGTVHRFRMRQIARALSATFDERLAERTQIARDLHDTLLQTIQGSKLVVNDALHKHSDEAKMRSALEQLSLWLEQATQEGRIALNSLRNATRLNNDLAEALQNALVNGPAAGSLTATISVVGASREMHPLVREEIYRIGYEAIRNAQVHSGGSRLEVELRYDLDFILRVFDNGAGIDPVFSTHGKDGHFGLQGMRERATRIGSKLTIASSTKFGTEISLAVPGAVAFLHPKTTLRSRIRTLFQRKVYRPGSQ